MLWLQDVIDSCSLKAPAEVRKPSAVKFPLMLANVGLPVYDMLYLNKWKIHTESAAGRAPPPPRTFTHARTLYYRKLPLSIIHLRPFTVIIHLMCPPRTLKPRCAGTLAGWDLLAGNRYHCISQDQHWPITGSLGQSLLHWQEAITHLMLKGLISC